MREFESLPDLDQDTPTNNAFSDCRELIKPRRDGHCTYRPHIKRPGLGYQNVPALQYRFSDGFSLNGLNERR